MNDDTWTLTRRLEELTLNTWQGLEEIHYDGWVIRFANGYTGRANSVNPIYPSTIPVGRKIDYCEELFRKRDIIPTFRISPIANPEGIVDHLSERGYEAFDPTWVMVLDMENYQHSPPQLPLDIRKTSLDAWLHLNYGLSSRDMVSFSTRKKIIQLVSERASFYIVKVGDEDISACMTISEGPFLGIFSLVVRLDCRKLLYSPIFDSPKHRVILKKYLYKVR